MKEFVNKLIDWIRKWKSEFSCNKTCNKNCNFCRFGDDCYNYEGSNKKEVRNERIYRKADW